MTETGIVYLVGAGPGDPGLLTLKGLECLQRADVVLYDGLVNPLLLRHTTAQTQRTCRVDGPAGRILNQVEINATLIAAAQEGKVVVRLKGGDPFIFGRGSEEASALREADIPFEIIPGITAATAASEYAGISLTHRNFASAVAFITGHEDPAKEESQLDYQLLAEFSGTLVFYMGLHRLSQIVDSLLQYGKSPETPACVMSRASTPLQKTVVAPLQELPAQVAAAGLHAPSLIIVGECVKQREQIAWFEDRPLFGQRIGITRPAGQSEKVIQQCLALGADPVLMPLIEITPPDDWQLVDDAIEQVAESVYQWLIFTSVNGVQALIERIWHKNYDLRILADVQIAVIGPATADALEKYHLRADLMPELYRAEELAKVLSLEVADKRLLWAGANRGREVLIDELTQSGARIDKVVVYNNNDIETLSPIVERNLQAGLNWVCLSSPSIARQFANLAQQSEILNALPASYKLAAISPVTEQAAIEVGLNVDVVAEDFTWQGMLNAIVNHKL